VVAPTGPVFLIRVHRLREIRVVGINTLFIMKRCSRPLIPSVAAEQFGETRPIFAEPQACCATAEAPSLEDRFTLIATELKKDGRRGGKNCHSESMMNTKS
jgi:hypothetical protein